MPNELSDELADGPARPTLSAEDVKWLERLRWDLADEGWKKSAERLGRILAVLSSDGGEHCDTDDLDRATLEQAQATLPCGHPVQCDPAHNDPNPGATHFCGWCAVVQERDAALALLKTSNAEVVDAVNQIAQGEIERLTRALEDMQEAQGVGEAQYLAALYARKKAEQERDAAVWDREETQIRFEEAEAERDRLAGYVAAMREALLDAGAWYRSDTDEFHEIHRALNDTAATASEYEARIRADERGRVLREAADAVPDGLNSLHKFRDWLRARSADERGGDDG